MDKAIFIGQSMQMKIDAHLLRYGPFKIIFFTAISTFSVCWFYDFIFREESVKKRICKKAFDLIRKIPNIKKRIQNEINKNIEALEDSFNHGSAGPLTYCRHLPENGLTKAEILNQISEYEKLDIVKWQDGWASGTVYVDNDELNDLMNQVYDKFMWSNPLHPETFPDVRKMEAEIVRICCNLFNGDDKSCGTTTSGGTESIMLAMKAYRDMAFDRGVRIPEMIVPVTAHAAFDKAAHYFRMKIHHVAVDPITFKVNVKCMKKLINRSTCVLVASAPQFPHGIVDPVEVIAELGEKYNIPVHVDCCLGGFLLPFMEKANCDLEEKFDFRVKGVTSISCDTHKYGFAPKGSSVIMYRSHDYRKYQFFVQPDWPGGVYATPTFAGSRAGVTIATCWASLMHHGISGYVKSTQEVVATAMKIKAGINKIPGLRVLGDPKVCVISIASDKINIYNLLDELHHCGWQLNPLQYPYSIHIAVTHIHTKPGVAERFLNDLRTTTENLMKIPILLDKGSAAVYGTSQKIPDRSIVAEVGAGFIAACYSTRGPT